MFNQIKKFVGMVAVFTIVVNCMGYGDTAAGAIRAARVQGASCGAQIMQKNNVRIVNVLNQVVGRAGDGYYCSIKLEVE